MSKLTLDINGKLYRVEAAPWESLNYVLRRRLHLTGTKRGCDTGGCGCCTALVDGEPIYSCMLLAHAAVGKKVLTIEGLEKDGKLDPVQEAFIENGGLQCGYCTPGMIMAAKALLMKNPQPTLNEIKSFLAGNVCRCTGYVRIFEAIQSVAGGR